MSATLDAEVLVVGGGPIGLAAAIEARLVGLTVIVVEPRTAPIDKACGEGLMPGTLAGLARLGVDPPGHDLVGISYRDHRRSADHEFSSGPGRGVRRTALHTALLERSAELTLTVPMRARYLPAGLRLEGALPETLEVTVSGPRILLCRLPLCGLSCGLDLSGAAAGTADFRPQADSLRLDRELKVVRTYPAALSLTLVKDARQR